MNDEANLIFLVFVVVVMASLTYNVSARSFAALMALCVTFVILANDTPGSIGEQIAHILQTTSDQLSRYISGCSANHKCRGQKELDTQYISEMPDEEAEKPSEYKGEYSDTYLKSKLEDVKKEYYTIGCIGDNALSLRMWENGRRAKQSQDIRARYDKYSALHIFDEELRAHANSIWWDNDALEHRF